MCHTFGIKDLGSYHDLYLKSDTLPLADVFENFCKTWLGHYGLDSAHYYKSPILSWDALLKSMVSIRHARANNPAVGYDPRRPTNCISYLDSIQSWLSDLTFKTASQVASVFKSISHDKYNPLTWPPVLQVAEGK